MKLIITIILAILLLASPAFAAGTYEDETHTQWGVAAPFLSATNLRLKRSATTMHDAGSETFTDIRGRSGDDIGAYNHKYESFPPLSNYGAPDLIMPSEAYRP